MDISKLLYYGHLMREDSRGSKELFQHLFAHVEVQENTFQLLYNEEIVDMELIIL